MSEKTYGPGQIERILKRAAKREARKRQYGSPEVGLTLDEIKMIALESGIDPDLVQHLATSPAAADLDNIKDILAGGPRFLHWKHRMDGIATSEMIEILDRFMDSLFLSRMRPALDFGGVARWSGQYKGVAKEIEVAIRDERTYVTLRANLSGVTLDCHVGTLLAVCALLGSLFAGSAIGAGVSVLTLGLAAAIGRSAVRRIRRRTRVRLDRVARKLSQLMELERTGRKIKGNPVIELRHPDRGLPA